MPADGRPGCPLAGHHRSYGRTSKQFDGRACPARTREWRRDHSTGVSSRSRSHRRVVRPATSADRALCVRELYTGCVFSPLVASLYPERHLLRSRNSYYQRSPFLSSFLYNCAFDLCLRNLGLIRIKQLPPSVFESQLRNVGFYTPRPIYFEFVFGGWRVANVPARVWTSASPAPALTAVPSPLRCLCAWKPLSLGLESPLPRPLFCGADGLLDPIHGLDGCSRRVSLEVRLGRTNILRTLNLSYYSDL